MSEESEAQQVSTDAKVHNPTSGLPRFVLPERVYKGIEMMVNEVENIEVMVTRPDDIWVCSHPRSSTVSDQLPVPMGTTLTQELSYLIETLDFERAKSVYLDDIFSMIDIIDDSFPFYRGMFGPWTKHVLGYWEQREQNNILFLKYEELVKDLPGHVRKIAAFLNKELSDDDVDRICKHCHVDRMRNNDKVNLSYWRVKQMNDDAI